MMRLFILVLYVLVTVTAIIRRSYVNGFYLQNTFNLPHNNILPSALRSSSSLEDLEIIDTQEGTGGDTAKFESIVTIKYTGKVLKTQEQFDQSMISFKLGYGKVLDGCDKGIRGMRVGGIRILKIPSRLGFGVDGFGPDPYSIPPNTDLEYTIELTALASGPMAEAAANLGIGLDSNTVYLK